MALAFYILFLLLRMNTFLTARDLSVVVIVASSICCPHHHQARSGLVRDAAAAAAAQQHGRRIAKQILFRYHRLALATDIY